MCPQGSIYFELWKGLPAAFVALVIGLIAAGIAWRQFKVAQAKLKLDLFEKRYAIFAAAWQYLSEPVRGAPDHPMHEFTNLLPQAEFLFGPEIGEYLNDPSKKRTGLWSIDQRMRRNANVMRPEDVDRNAFLTNWFFEQASTGLKAIFAPYLDFERWR